MTQSTVRTFERAWRRWMLPTALLLQSGVLVSVLWGMAHHEPDYYFRQHLRLFLGSLSGCALISAIWIERPSAKKWLVALTFALLAAAFVAGFVR